MFSVTVSSIVTAAYSEDHEAGALLERIFNDHHKRMLSIAFSVLHNNADAEDAAAEAFKNLWKHIDRFKDKDEDDIKRLVTTYVKNAALNIYRTRNAKKNDTVSFESDDYLAGIVGMKAGFDLEETVINKERIREFAQCIDRLPETDRQILLLKYRYEYSGKEISEVMNMSVTAVNNRVSRAREKLKTMMEQVENG